MSNDEMEVLELVVIRPQTIIQAFTDGDGLDEVIDQARSVVESFDHDLATEAGRKKTASLAHKVAKLKVSLDNMGKDLVAEWKSKAKTVDNSRKEMREALDELKVEARKPLTEWEAEQERIKAEEEAKRLAEDLARQVESDHEIALLLGEKFDREAREEAERIEAERIAKENEIKRIAAEAATKKAEDDAKAERERIENEKREAVQRAHDAEIAAEQARLEKEQAAASAKLEAERVAAKAKADSEAAAEKARTDEIQRQADEKARLDAEEKARASDRKHKAVINNQMLDAFVSGGLSAENAKTAVKLLASGRIPNIKVNY